MSSSNNIISTSYESETHRGSTLELIHAEEGAGQIYAPTEALGKDVSQGKLKRSLVLLSTLLGVAILAALCYASSSLQKSQENAQNVGSLSSGSRKSNRQLETTCKDQRPVFQYNTNVWWDPWGNTCSWYTEDSKRCNSESGNVEMMGLTAKQACCACGGGATTFEAISHLNNCQDTLGWTDVWGQSCDWYGKPGENFCLVYGDYESQGSSPNHACCACGGCSRTDNVPVTTTRPTATPTAAPVSTSSSNGSSGTSGNPIEVPSALVPHGAATDTTTRFCKDVDLSSIQPSSNPGYDKESMAGEFLSSDTIWQTSFYAMLYANCERQARGLEPFYMYSDTKMVSMQVTYRFRKGHDKYDERAAIAGGITTEAAGGAPFTGSVIESWDALGQSEDDNANGLWDAQESGRRVAMGLLDHGDSMIDPDLTGIFGSATIGPTADNYLNSVLMYGDDC